MISFCFELHTLSFNLHLHSHNSCCAKNFVSFAPDSKLNTFACIFFTLFETQIQAHCSSIMLQPLSNLLTLKINGSKRILREFISTIDDKH